MNNNNLKNNLDGEREILPADEQKVCDLMSRLDKVDCPKDFHFHLKARIANANQKDFQPSVWQTLRYILPVAACVLIVAFVMVQAGMFSPGANQNENNFASTANPKIEQPIIEIETAKDIPASNSNAAIVSTNQSQIVTANSFSNIDVALKKPIKNPNTVVPKVSKEDEPTMWRDLGVGQNKEPIYPKNYDPTKIKPQTEENQSVKPVSTKDVFNFINLETEFVGGKLTVKNVRENTIAYKSGFRAGDIIESVDDTKMTRSEMILKSNSVKKITVSRGGKIVEIRLQPN